MLIGKDRCRKKIKSKDFDMIRFSEVETSKSIEDLGSLPSFLQMSLI